MVSRRKSYRRKVYSGGQNSFIPAPAPADVEVKEGKMYSVPLPAAAPAPAQVLSTIPIDVSQLQQNIEADILYLMDLIRSQSPDTITMMYNMQGSDLAKTIGSDLQQHIMSNLNETIPELYAYIQTVYQQNNITLPNIDFSQGDTARLAKEKMVMISNIQNALTLMDPSLLAQMTAMQGTALAKSTGTALAAHINDPANVNETLQQLYSYVQTLFAKAELNFPNLNFNADGTLNLVVVSEAKAEANKIIATSPSPSPASYGGRRKSRKSRKSRKLNRRSK